MRAHLLAIPVIMLTQCEPACDPVDPPAEAWTVNWDNVAQCESGGNWGHPPVSNSSGTYSGGLMIGHRWWGPNGGKQYAEWPYQATKAQQIAVAENIVDANGGGYAGADRGWQCVD